MARESEPLLNSKGTIVFRKGGTTLVYSRFSKYRGFGIYSMKRTGGRRKMFITKANAEWSGLPKPTFRMKFLYDYGF